MMKEYQKIMTVFDNASGTKTETLQLTTKQDTNDYVVTYTDYVDCRITKQVGLQVSGNMTSLAVKGRLAENTAEVTFEMAMNLTDIQDTQRLLFLKDFFEFFVRKGKINSDLHLDGEPRENLQGNANTGFITFAAVFKANEYQKLLINGVQVASTSAVSPSSVPIAGTIGGTGYPIANGSKLYSMRVYKRALTTEELAQNFEIDQARFGLTETASVMMLGDEEVSE